MRRGLSDRYIKRPSATILAVTKILEGVAAGYALYVLLGILIQAVSTAATLSEGIRYLPKMAINDYGVADFLRGSISALFRDESLPVFISGGILILILIGLALSVIDAVAVLILRFGKKGVRLVKVIHMIYMVSDCIHLPLFICVVINYMIRNANLLVAVKTVEIGETEIDIYMICVAAFYLLFLVLRICYHKSVSSLMRTVFYDIKGGARGYFTWTHLSGISFFISLLYIIDILFFFITLLFEDPIVGELKDYAIIVLIVNIILVLKQYSICFCCRNLKKAHQESDMRIPSRIR